MPRFSDIQPRSSVQRTLNKIKQWNGNFNQNKATIYPSKQDFSKIVRDMGIVLRRNL